MPDQKGDLSLEELLADPMVRLLMTRDGLHPETVRRTLAPGIRDEPPPASLAGNRCHEA
jgi:hypothetical protein